MSIRKRLSIEISLFPILITGLVLACDPNGSVPKGSAAAPIEPKIVKTSAGIENVFSPGRVKLRWARGVGGKELEIARGAAASADGSIVITGEFLGEAEFAEGSYRSVKLHSQKIGSDFFIAKYNSDGSLAWARSALGDKYNSGFAIAGLADGSLAATGAFSGKVVFGKGEKNESVLKSTEKEWDIFVAKYGSGGSLDWVRCATGDGYDEGLGIASSRDGSIFVTGRFRDDLVLGKKEREETTLKSDGPGWSALIAKYDSKGTLAWARRAAGFGDSEGAGVAATENGGVVFTGRFYGRAIFGEGEAKETALICSARSGEVGNNPDAFVAALDSAGRLRWVRRAGGPGYDEGRRIAAGDDGSVVITGLFEGKATFASGDKNEQTLVSDGKMSVFAAKYDWNGAIQWAKKVGDGGEYSLEHDIAGLPDGSVIIAGGFNANRLQAVGKTTKTLPAKQDSFTSLVKYDTDGSRVWTEALKENDICKLRAIVAHEDGSFTAVGGLSDKIEFGGHGTKGLSIHSAGMSDIFLIRLVD